MEKIIYILSIILFTSCSTSKKILQTDKTVAHKTIERREIIRKGDTLTIDIPNIRYKDTTIVRTNYENKTIARVTYDDKGNQKFDCLSAEINEKLELINETVANNVENKRDVERDFNPQYFIYALAALAFIIIIGFIVFGIVITKLKKSVIT